LWAAEDRGITAKIETPLPSLPDPAYVLGASASRALSAHWKTIELSKEKRTQGEQWVEPICQVCRQEKVKEVNIGGGESLKCLLDIDGAHALICACYGIFELQDFNR